MASKLGRMLTNVEGLLLINLYGTWATWSFGIMWQTSPNLTRPSLNMRGSDLESHMEPWLRGFARSCGKIKIHLAYRSTFDYQIGEVVIYNDELPPITLHDRWITWFCEVTCQIRCFISLLVLDQWPPNIERCWLAWRGSTHKFT